MRFVFDDLVLDTERLLLERDGQPVHVQPQVFDVLAFLLLHRDRVVSKEELLDNVWGDRFVGESALTSRIKSARQLVGDDGVAQAYIATVYGRGYRWVGPAAEVGEPAAAREGKPAVTSLIDATPAPVPLTSFVGRAEELSRVAAALETHRLVTVVGPPGVGKSRLAIESSHRIARDDAAKIAFVDLRLAHAPGDVVHVVSGSLGVTQAPQMPEPSLTRDPADVVAVLEQLGTTRLLVLLDNCEHVVEAVRTLCAVVLPTCPTVSVVATSRRSLGLDGEAVVVIDPLPTVAADASGHGPSWGDVAASDAGRLFIERSTSAGARWRHTPTEGAQIATICRRLDGLPLAIELAAARSRWLAADELVRQLDDRLVTVDGSAHLTPALDASLQSSRDLLAPDSARAFDALSVFDGSFTLDAAMSVITAVCRDRPAAELLGALVDHSLVDVVDVPRRRYRMLQAVQQFARSRLGESDRESTAVAAHIAHYIAFVEGHCPPARISGCSWQPLDDDFTELLVAIERASESAPHQARRLIGAIGWYWVLSGHAETCAALCESVAPADAGHSRRTSADARFLWAWSNALKFLGEHRVDLARAAYDAALETEQWSVAAWSLVNVVGPDWFWLELDAVAPRWREIIDLFRRGHDRGGEAWATVYVLGSAQKCAGHRSDACATYERAVELFEAAGDRHGTAQALMELAEFHLVVGEPDAARSVYRRMQAVVDNLPAHVQGHMWWLGGALAETEGRFEDSAQLQRRAFDLLSLTMPRAIKTNTLRCMLARALRRSGALHEAAAQFGRALTFVVQSDLAVRWQHGTWVLESLAGTLTDLGHAEAAAELLGAAAAGRDRLEAPMPYWDRPGYDEDVDALRAAIEPAVFDERWRAGAALDLPAAFRRASSVVADILSDEWLQPTA